MGSNLTPTSQSIEVIFTIIMVLAGLGLFTFLIGNIQVIIFKIKIDYAFLCIDYLEIYYRVLINILGLEILNKEQYLGVFSFCDA